MKIILVTLSVAILGGTADGCILKIGRNICAYSQEDGQKLDQFIEEDDRQSIREMSREGRITAIPEGTVVVTEDFDLSSGIARFHVRGSSKHLYVRRDVILAAMKRKGGL